MSLDLGELVGKARLDLSPVRADLRDLDQILTQAAEQGATKAGKAGGDALADGVTQGARRGSQGVSKAADQWKGDAQSGGQRAGQAGGQAIADGVKSGSSDATAAVARVADGWKADAARGGQQAGDKAGEGIADGVRDGAGKTRSTIADSARTWVAPAERGGEQAGDAAGDGLLGGIKEKASGIKETISGLLSGEGAAIGGAGVGLAIGAALAKGIQGALEQNSVNKHLQAQLGLTKAQSAQTGQAAGKLFAGGYGEGMEDIGEAIRLVVQNIDGMRNASDDTLTDVAGKALTLSNVFGQDLEGSTAAVAQMLRTGLAKNADEAFDILTVGFQQGDDKAGDLLDTVTEYGTQFRKLGIDGTSAMGLLSQGLKGGARDADLVADAIKEFSIRAVDGSTQTADGFRRIGLNSDEMTEKIAKGGKSARGGLQQVLDGLRGIKDPATRAQIAVELFGTQSEDLGAALYDLNLDTAASGMGKVAGATDRANNAFNDTPSAKMSTFFRSLQQGATNIIGGLLVPMLDKASDSMSGIVTLAGTTGHAVAGTWNAIPGPAQNAALAIGAVAVAQRLFGDRLASGRAKIGTYVGSMRSLTSAQQAASREAANVAGGMQRSATGIGAIVRTTSGSAVQVGRFGTAIHGLGQQVPTIARLQGAFLGAAQGAERFPRAAGTAAAAMTGLKSAGSGLLGVLGGPWGLALAGGVIALTAWQKHQADAAQRVAEHKQQVEQLTSAIEQDGGAIGEATRKQLVNTLAQKDAFNTAKQYGVSIDTVTQAAMGNKQALNDLKTGLIEGTDASYQAAYGSAVMDDKAKGLYNTIRDLSGSTKESLQADKQKASALDAAGKSYVAATTSVTPYERATKAAADASKDADKAARSLKQGIDGVNNSFLESQASEDGYEAAIDDATAALKENGKTLDANTEKGRANRSALRDIASTGLSYADSLAKQGASAKTVAAQIEATRSSYVKSAMAMGASRSEATKLADDFIRMPKQVTTKIKADATLAKANLAAARAAVKQLSVDFDSLPASVQTKIAATGGKNAKDEVDKVAGAVKGAPKQLKIASSTPGADGSLLRINKLSVAAVDANGKIVHIPCSTPGQAAALNAILKLHGAQISANGKQVVIHSSAPLAESTKRKIDAIRGARVDANGNVVVNTSSPGAVQATNNILGAGNAADRVNGKHATITITTKRVEEILKKVGTIHATANANGGVVAPGGLRVMADGGIAGRQAMIAKGGSNVLWAEDETHGEAYIPFAMSKRARALQVLRTTAGMMGQDLVPKAAAASAVARVADPGTIVASTPRASSYARAGAAGVTTAQLSPEAEGMIRGLALAVLAVANRDTVVKVGERVVSRASADGERADRKRAW